MTLWPISGYAIVAVVVSSVILTTVADLEEYTYPTEYRPLFNFRDGLLSLSLLLQCCC